MRGWKRSTDIGKFCGVRGYIAPRQLVEIASDRTFGMVSAFVRLGAKTEHLNLLAQSCYMQGINDATDSLIMTKALKEPQ